MIVLKKYIQKGRKPVLFGKEFKGIEKYILNH